MKISKYRTNFIPVPKSNLAGKNFDFAKTSRNPKFGCTLIEPPNSLQRLKNSLGFAPGVEKRLLVVVICWVHFTIVGFHHGTLETHGFVIPKFKLKPNEIWLEMEEGKMRICYLGGKEG